jgi:hypothetical protein
MGTKFQKYRNKNLKNMGTKSKNKNYTNQGTKITKL